MLRARLLSILAVVSLGALVPGGAARAQETSDLTVGEMPVPGGLRAALAAIGDRTAPDRAQFLLEFIRRTYDTPIASKTRPRDAGLDNLIAHLDRATLSIGGRAETVPLPLPARVWHDVVFGGRLPSPNLMGAIVGSRGAALLYHGLLSLDDQTRAWLASEPALIAEIVTRHPSVFSAAAPGLRVIEGRVRVPGGEAAEPAWEALVGHPVGDRTAFVRALLANGQGRLAYFFGATAHWTPAQLRSALNLDSPDAAARIDAARRLLALFERIVPGWKVEERSFWRPPIDPALLIADLPVDEEGRPAVPGSRLFWSMVFGEVDSRVPGRSSSAERASQSANADLPWLCEQVFKGEQFEQHRRYQLVVFGSRLLDGVTPDSARDAAEAIRAFVTHPALVSALHRAGLRDVGAFASVTRRAAQLSAIDDEGRALVALAQFQGAMVLVTRAAIRGSLPKQSLAGLVVSLSAVPLSERGDYEGRLIRWLDDHVREWTAPGKGAPAHDAESVVEPYAVGSFDANVLRLLAGNVMKEAPVVEWEGTRYRIDFARAETARLARVLGEQPRPYFSTSRAFLDVADALTDTRLVRDELRAQSAVLEHAALAVECAAGEGWGGGDLSDRCRDAVAAVQRAAADADVRGAARLAPRLRGLAEDLLARGLVEIAYAIALGQPDRASISAAEAAGRHEFWRSVAGAGRTSVWRLPLAGVDPARSWHATGSLLGLDVKLADMALMRVSSRPLLRRPTLNDEDRRVLIEAVVLIEPTALGDDDRDVMLAAIRKGRARLAEVRTWREALAIGDAIRLGPARRTLLAWAAAHDPQRVPSFLSPAELLWLGLDRTPVGARFHAWGAPAGSRLGCLCQQMTPGRPWELHAGRWNSGMLASLFPDLNLRLAELLAELRMPASLVAPVLAPATFEFVNNAASRDADDRRALVEYVEALRVDRVEQYLALLTTDGPLVPIGETPGVRDVAGALQPVASHTGVH